MTDEREMNELRRDSASAFKAAVKHLGHATLLATALAVTSVLLVIARLLGDNDTDFGRLLLITVSGMAVGMLLGALAATARSVRLRERAEELEQGL